LTLYLLLFGIFGCLLLQSSLGFSYFQVLETHLVSLVMGGLVLIILRSLYLELIILFFLFILLFLRLWLWIRFLLLLLLILIFLSFFCTFEMILCSCESFVHILNTLSHLCYLILINLWHKVLFYHLSVLDSLVNEGFCPTF
jgi:hypothetical protein